MRAGIEGLLRDKTRPSRIPPLGAEATAKVVALTQGDPPGETTHWTAEMMAKAVGISPCTRRRENPSLKRPDRPVRSQNSIHTENTGVSRRAARQMNFPAPP